jgi:hypothetical protein
MATRSGSHFAGVRHFGQADVQGDGKGQGWRAKARYPRVSPDRGIASHQPGHVGVPQIIKISAADGIAKIRYAGAGKFGRHHLARGIHYLAYLLAGRLALQARLRRIGGTSWRW